MQAVSQMCISCLLYTSNENSSVKKEQGAKGEVCDNRELGVAHSVQDKSSVEISPDMAYPTYNFSWAGGQAKGASP